MDLHSTSDAVARCERCGARIQLGDEVMYEVVTAKWWHNDVKQCKENMQ